jgi:hypothetical protein
MGAFVVAQLEINFDQQFVLSGISRLYQLKRHQNRAIVQAMLEYL